MLTVTQTSVGRVIRVGRRCVDVLVDGKVRRITTRPDLLIRAGNYVQIINEQAIGVLPSDHRYHSERLH